MHLIFVLVAYRSPLSVLLRRVVLADVLAVKLSKTADSTGLVVHIPLYI